MDQVAQRPAVLQCQGRPLPSGSTFLLPAVDKTDSDEANFCQKVEFHVEGPSFVYDLRGSPFTLGGLTDSRNSTWRSVETAIGSAKE